VRACGIVFAVLAGCQTYRSRPLDLSAHRAAWEARAPHADGVRELAARLAESRPAVGTGFDEADGLSLAEGEAVALLYNADLRIARLRAAGAGAVARTAGRWQDPVFGFAGERILAGVTHPWIAAASLAVTLPFSGRLDAEKREACAEERAAIARVVADEWAVRIRLRALWIQWSFQSLRAELVRGSSDRVAGVAAVAARLEEAGELSRIEGRIFRAERASRAVELRTEEARATELELEIKELMGLLPESPLRLAPEISASQPPPAIVDDHPALAALRAEYEVTEEALRLEIRKQYPDLTVAPGFREEDGDPRVTLGVELPLPIWNRNVRGIASARSKREIARAEAEKGYESLVAKLAAARHQLAAANARRADLEATLIPLVEEQSAEVDRVAQLGQVDTLVALDTLLRQHEAKLKLLEARLQEALAVIRLQDLAGPSRWRRGGSP
jgi:CRISPR system Cascade subunit CasA